MQFSQNCDHFLDAFINATYKMVPFLIRSFPPPLHILVGRTYAISDISESLGRGGWE